MNKKALISLVHAAANTSIEGNDFSVIAKNDILILLTAAGQITGTLLKTDKSQDLHQQITDAFFLQLSESFVQKIKEDSFLLLKNATLKTSCGDFTYRYLYVFTDDIIAASIGNADAE